MSYAGLRQVPGNSSIKTTVWLDCALLLCKLSAPSKASKSLVLEGICLKKNKDECASHS